MLVNLVEINGATTTSWLTGDVNGPTLVWAQDPGPEIAVWAKDTV